MVESRSRDRGCLFWLLDCANSWTTIDIFAAALKAFAAVRDWSMDPVGICVAIFVGVHTASKDFLERNLRSKSLVGSWHTCVLGAEYTLGNRQVVLPTFLSTKWQGNKNRYQQNIPYWTAWQPPLKSSQSLTLCKERQVMLQSLAGVLGVLLWGTASICWEIPAGSCCPDAALELSSFWSHSLD